MVNKTKQERNKKIQLLKYDWEYLGLETTMKIKQATK
jgi:hypothetical protein